MFLYFRHIKAYDPHEGKDNERRLTGKLVGWVK